MEASFSSNSFFISTEPKDREGLESKFIKNNIISGIIVLGSFFISPHTQNNTFFDQFSSPTINHVLLLTNEGNSEKKIVESYSVNETFIKNTLFISSDTDTDKREGTSMERIENKIDTMKDDNHKAQLDLIEKLSAISNKIANIEKNYEDLPTTIERIIKETQEKAKEKWYERIIAPSIVGIVVGIIVALITAKI